MITKRWFDKIAWIKSFKLGDLVLMWDKAREGKGEHTKFDKLWLGPFQIAEFVGPNSFKLEQLIGELLPLPINGKHLKHYFHA